ncbi:MAG: hypothetical protein JWM87_4223 [Candidatus Eremiobacteraeota bacterium]|nr:hypothetical protein [Candidatus Eremiobacteraeota bacterium]
MSKEREEAGRNITPQSLGKKAEFEVTTTPQSLAETPARVKPDESPAPHSESSEDAD